MAQWFDFFIMPLPLGANTTGWVLLLWELRVSRHSGGTIIILRRFLFSRERNMKHILSSMVAKGTTIYCFFLFGIEAEQQLIMYIFMYLCIFGRSRKVDVAVKWYGKNKGQTLLLYRSNTQYASETKSPVFEPKAFALNCAEQCPWSHQRCQLLIPLIKQPGEHK